MEIPSNTIQVDKNLYANTAQQDNPSAPLYSDPTKDNSPGILIVPKNIGRGLRFDGVMLTAGKVTIDVDQTATPFINTDTGDIFTITGLAQAITSFTKNLTGTPQRNDYLVIQITDNGTARALTWGALFQSTTVTLPTTTVISKMLRVGLQWNVVAAKWDCIAVV